MSENQCSCESTDCGSGCSSGGCGGTPQSLIEKTHELNDIKKVIGVVSGKGGVGKSLVTSLMAVMMRRKGYNVGVLDADITGPSIPKVFGIHQKAEGSELGIFPQKTHNDIRVMSVNLLLEQEDAPVIWRGPMIAGVVKQFWTDVIWGGLDFLFLDMPPGTGDVPLTVFQSIPLDGIIIVTTPQDLVSLIVSKALKMAESMQIPVLGIVENMSYLECPDCKKKFEIFGKSKLEEIAKEHDLKILGRIPINPAVAERCDQGEVEKLDVDYLNEAVAYMEGKLMAKQQLNNMKIAVATEGDQVSEHFGRCDNFTIFEIENGSVKSKQAMSTMGHQHGELPPYLKSQDVGLAILGGIGAGAKQGMVANGIDVIAGISGSIDAVVEQFLAGNLAPGKEGCSGHDHGHGESHASGGCSCGH